MIQASRRAFAILVVAATICFGGKTAIGIHRRPLVGFADAFCTGRNIDAGRRGSKTVPFSLALAARRPGNDNGNGNGNKNVTDMVSYLEKVYQNSNTDDSLESSDSESNDSGAQPLQFQTPVTTYTNAPDLFDSIDNAPPNELTVVLCFAHYCKTCQRANIPFKQLAYDHDHDNDHDNDNDNDNEQGDSTSPRTRFVRLETSALSPHQFRSLGIDRVPFLQIYRNGICVASRSAVERVGRTGTRLVLRPRLLEALEACKGRSASGWAAFRKAFATEIEANLAARRGLRERHPRDKNDDDDDDDDDDNNNDASGGGSADAWYQSVRTLTSEAELLGLLTAGDRCREGGDNGKGSDENDPEGEEIVVVMVHSHFDPSCRRAQHKFRKLADERRQKLQQRQRQRQREHGEGTTPSCIMARIEASLLSDDTLRHLGIQNYPHIQIYYHRRADPPDEPESEQSQRKMTTTTTTTTTTKRCVASFSIPRSYLFGKLLHESLDAIDRRTREDWRAFEQRHGDEIRAQREALERILRKQKQKQKRDRRRSTPPQ